MMSYLSKNLKIKSLILGILALLSSIVTNVVEASTDGFVRIYDCVKSIRFEQNVSGESDLIITLPGLYNGEEISLRDYSTGDITATSIVEQGFARFIDIESGEWIICPSKGEVQNVSLISTGIEDADSSFAAVALTGVLGAVTAGVVTFDSSSSSSDTSLFPSNENNVTDTAASSGTGSTSRPKPRASETSECFLDEDVEPLSPIS